jgi:hypothetical protein
MSRQINLYSAEFRRQRLPFSASWIVLGFMGSAVLASGYYAIVTQPLPEMRARRTESGAQLKALREELVVVAKAVKKPANKELEDQVARAEAQLKARQELVVRLQGGEIGNREGYSKYLLGLARQRIDGVWLTGIDISGPADDFSVRGRAQRASQISDYIKLLGKEEGFRGKPIGTLSMSEREIELAGDSGGGTSPLQRAGATAPQSPPATGPRPRMRALEFVIGTGAASATEDAGK